jgi:hypothetical protein
VCVLDIKNVLMELSRKVKKRQFKMSSVIRKKLVYVLLIIVVAGVCMVITCFFAFFMNEQFINLWWSVKKSEQIEFEVLKCGNYLELSTQKIVKIPFYI